jgi:predicted esterase
MIHKSIRVQKTAHYYEGGVAAERATSMWFLCHGYAQCADTFLSAFSPIENYHRLIAPEGLNHAYLRGFEGEVGANWMTKRHRVGEIEDFAFYLTSLLQLVKSQSPWLKQTVVVGFSQGVATVLRWMHQNRPAVNHLILWSGLPPEDIEYLSAEAYWRKIRIHWVVGKQDPFLSPASIKTGEQIFNKNSIQVQTYLFDGGHELRPDLLLRLHHNLEDDGQAGIMGY